MGLIDELERITSAASAYAGEGESVEGILVAEPTSGERTYVCAFTGGGERTWLALDSAGAAVTDRERVREAISIAAMCEVAEESAGGGELAELRSQLLTLRLTENPSGIEEAEAAAHALENAIGRAPRVASPDYLEAVGSATRRLERALGDNGTSPFATAMKQALGAVEELAKEVEAHYKLTLT